MLASPRYPSLQSTFTTSHSESEQAQYRPAKDLDAFNSLLPPPIEFIEGSSTGTLIVAEGKYPPINAVVGPSSWKALAEVPPPTSNTTPSSPETSNARSNTPVSTPAQSPIKRPVKTITTTASLYRGDVELSWPQGATLGAGLFNTGNTCFLNSALQCLLHTPPLLHILNAHRDCKAKGFCMTCLLREVAGRSFQKRAPFSPSIITNKLQIIAKHMRRGRQEDSHEFLRYAIDALQKSCLAGHSTKIEHRLAETTWVHKVFGGRLRSRVTCHDCGHNSDTFDSILDLSLDIHRAHNLSVALRKFVEIDHLKGADKYKCEKCKKHVNAEKQFTIHEAPAVLTIHLKRFSPMGHKIGHIVEYDEHLNIDPFMSEGQYGPRYTLYGVICHAGGGPNSGHYYAFVRSRENKWYEMNDESVTSRPSPPTRIKNAYMLFYLRNKGQKLDMINFSSTQQPKSGLVAAMRKKRARDEEGEEDQGEKVTKPFIGPLLPSPTTNPSSPSEAKRPRLENTDPQASKLKKKIQEVQATTNTALSELADYVSDDDDNSPPKEESSKLSAVNGTPTSSTPTPSPNTPNTSAISAATFYGTPGLSKKREDLSPANANYHSTWKKNNFNPYNRFGGKKNKGTARGF
ncbi:cysteine proteinase [Marasmius fiardii PR-910]|nr:cysteine proteinase [Marasmius fiardii PR-910]